MVSSTAWRIRGGKGTNSDKSNEKSEFRISGNRFFLFKEKHN